MIEIFGDKELSHTKLDFVMGISLIIRFHVVFDAIIFVDINARFSLDFAQANLVLL